MDILLYAAKNDEIGAVRHHTMEVLYHLSRMGHPITYIDGQRYSPIPAKELDLKTGGRRNRSPWERVKIFVAALPLRGETWFLWSSLREAKLLFSAVVTVLRHRPEVIYRRHALFSSEYLVAKLFNIPAVKEVNGIWVNELRFAKRADSITLRVVGWVERFTMPKADRIIVVTPRLGEILQQDYRVPSDRISVILNGANIDLFKPMDTGQARRELGLNQDSYYVCYVGSLERWQGVEYIIKSLPLIIDRCPETQLLVVGDGPMKQELKELAELVGVSSKVIFTGTVPYHKAPLYINASDVCVLPKIHTPFGLSPLKLYEYMACGKPIVASRVIGLEVIEKCDAGALVNREDSHEVTLAISELLKNRELRRSLGENGRKYVVENQSWQSVAQKVADACQNCIDSWRKRRDSKQ